MDKFSINIYNNLPENQKEIFNETLARKLSSLVNEIKADNDLKPLLLEGFISKPEDNATSVVSELYSKITSGIQVGSGNQKLFLGILNAFVEAWSETIKK